MAISGTPQNGKFLLNCRLGIVTKLVDLSSDGSGAARDWATRAAFFMRVIHIQGISTSSRDSARD